MPAYYSVVQYFPEVIRDERINIGVMTFDQNSETVYCKFLDNWDRVAHFVNNEHQLRFVKEWAESAMKDPWTASEIRKTIEKQGVYSTVWFRELAGSLRPASQLVEDMAKSFLVNKTEA